MQIGQSSNGAAFQICFNFSMVSETESIDFVSFLGLQSWDDTFTTIRTGWSIVESS